MAVDIRMQLGIRCSATRIHVDHFHDSMLPASELVSESPKPPHRTTALHITLAHPPTVCLPHYPMVAEAPPQYAFG
jgi:hypothetical protein